MIFLTTLSFISAVFLEWMAGPVFSFMGVSFPAVLAVAIFLFWKMKLSTRIFCGIFAGIFMDAVSAYPPGTYLILFFVAAIFTEVLRWFFSETESYVVRGISMATVLFICINLIHPLASVMSVGGVYYPELPFSWVITVFVASIFWAIAAPLFFFCIGRLAKSTL